MFTSGCWGGQRDPGGLRVESASARSAGFFAPVALAQLAGPDPPGRAVLGDLLEEVEVRG